MLRQGRDVAINGEDLAVTVREVVRRALPRAATFVVGYVLLVLVLRVTGVRYEQSTVSELFGLTLVAFAAAFLFFALRGVLQARGSRQHR